MVYSLTVEPPPLAAGVGILYPIPFVAAGNFITIAGVPLMSGMPKPAVVLNCVPKAVGPPPPSVNARLPKVAPAVAVRLLLLKSHWPMAASRDDDVENKTANMIAAGAMSFDAFFMGFLV